MNTHPQSKWFRDTPDCCNEMVSNRPNWNGEVGVTNTVPDNNYKDNDHKATESN